VDNRQRGLERERRIRAREKCWYLSVNSPDLFLDLFFDININVNIDINPNPNPNLNPK